MITAIFVVAFIIFCAVIFFVFDKNDDYIDKTGKAGKELPNPVPPPPKPPLPPKETYVITRVENAKVGSATTCPMCGTWQMRDGFFCAKCVLYVYKVGEFEVATPEDTRPTRGMVMEWCKMFGRNK